MLQKGGDLRPPKHEPAMFLERRHGKQNLSVVQESRRPPFDGFFRARAAVVHQRPEAPQHGPGELSSILDVFVDSRIGGHFLMLWRGAMPVKRLGNCPETPALPKRLPG
ncbi:MAG TPA: hypothetical protein VH302_05450 [Bryobacteraceae bacterium]|nr:hypothetical protein [Bryobacteraceae bacterium]